MSRPLTTILAIFFVMTTAVAQKNYKRSHYTFLEEARRALAMEEYAQAARTYKRLLPIDTGFAEVNHELAVCYANMPDERDKATPLFERAVRLGHTEAVHELAMVRHRQQRFSEAVDLFERYKQLNYRLVRDAEVDRKIAMSRSAKELVMHPVELRIRNMGALINSPAHDYCPVVKSDGSVLYFTSRRAGSTGGYRDATGQYLEDIYMVRRIDDVWTNAVNARTPLNTGVHDATVGLAPDGSSMIIYRTHENMVSGDLYECRLENGSWKEPVVMTDRINSKHHEPSASIAPGGDEIYFTSDRPGGFGGRDLYRIRRLPNGEWSLPLNLGPQVNTPYDEDAPFIHSDGLTLFFSSNGHNTMGGYDIFKTVLQDPDINGWGKPENMGYPLNTVNDDIYFCLSEDGTTGWFSSERPGGQGMQDIYQVDFAGSQLDYVVVRGLVTDNADDPLRARIIVTDKEAEEVIGVYNTNERTGRYIMVLQPGEHYRMTVESPGYVTRTDALQAKAAGDTREMPLDIQMQPGEQSLTHNDGQ